MPESNPPDESAEDQRAFEIVSEVMSRRSKGEFISDAEVLKANPDLLRPLQQHLANAASIEAMFSDDLGDLVSRMEDDPDFGTRSASLLDGPGLPADSSAVPSTAPELDPATGGHRPPTEDPPQSVAAPSAARPGDPRAASPTEEKPSSVAADEEPADSETHELDSSALVSSSNYMSDEPAGADPESQNKRTVAIVPAKQETPTQPYQPKLRPPMAVLMVRDDNQNEGELFRLRGDTTIIGRNQGEVTIPHDFQMSGQHASITRETTEDEVRWVLRDLGSRNGTFVRVRRAIMKDEDLLLVGSRLVRFHDPRPAGPCRLEAVSLGQVVETFELEMGCEYWIGRDPKTCIPLLGSEPMLDMQHALVAHDEHGTWSMLNNNSLNGVWVRVLDVPLAHKAAFQLGEQRFLFLVR